MTLKNRTIYFFLLHISLVIYSFSSVLMKYAATSEFFSFRFFLFYALALLTLAVYALLWQQILGRFKLNFVYANHAMGMLWVVMFGVILFKESLSLTRIIGMVLIFIGVVITVTTDE